jgi:O-antigen/teichoic acid export membrane protein
MTFIERFVQKKFHIDAPYFLRGGFWLSLSQVITIVAGICVSALFAHMLTEHEYGTYRYLIGIGVFLTSFSLTGFGQSVLQTAAKKYRQFYNETIGIALLYNLGITLASIIGATYYFYKGNDTLALGCIIVALIQPVINTYQNIFPFLQGSRRFRESTVSQTIKTIVVSGASIGAIFITQNILVLLAAYLLSHALTNLVSHFYYRPQNSTPTPPDVFTKYLSYAKNTSLRTIITSIAFRLDTIIIFTWLGATELAIYTIAMLIPEQIKGSVKNMATLIMPKYAQHSDITTLKKTVFKRSIQLFFIFSGIALVYVLAAPFLYTLLFPKYETAIFYSQLTALSFPTMIAVLPYSALKSQLRERELYSYTIQNSILSIILTLLLIWLFGLIGAVMARVASRLLIMILTIFHFTKIKELK